MQRRGQGHAHQSPLLDNNKSSPSATSCMTEGIIGLLDVIKIFVIDFECASGTNFFHEMLL